ncbi:MAG: FAD-dependent oxidoreductase, partial [bacterium]
MLESSHLYHEAQHGLGKHGIQLGEVKLDLPSMMGRKNQIVDTLTGGIDLLFKKNKVTAYRARGRFRDVDSIVVEGAGELMLLKAKHFIIATGSRPASMRGVEEDGQRIG